MASLIIWYTGGDTCATLFGMALRKKKTRDKGRWMVERERYGLANDRPDVPFVEAKSVEVGLKNVFDKLGIEQVDVQTALREEWGQLVGEDNAARTRPGGIENKILTIFVKGSVWYAQLKRIGVTEIQKRIVARFGKTVIQGVVLKPE